MKAFKFRLDRALQLRERQLKTEEAALEDLFNRREQMTAEMKALDVSLQQARVSIQSQQFVHPSELISLDRYNGRVDRERKEWQLKIAAQDALIEKQKAKVVEARGAVRLLEKLRDKRKLEWQAEGDKEMEELATDFSAAQWLRLRKRQAG
jgi:flagellar protein FliJ